MYEYFVRMYVSACLVPKKARRGRWIPWSWVYRWLRAVWGGCWELNSIILCKSGKQLSDSQGLLFFCLLGLFVCFGVLFFVFRGRVSLYIPGCPGTHSEILSQKNQPNKKQIAKAYFPAGELRSVEKSKVGGLRTSLGNTHFSQLSFCFVILLVTQAGHTPIIYNTWEHKRGSLRVWG